MWYVQNGGPCNDCASAPQGEVVMGGEGDGGRKFCAIKELSPLVYQKELSAIKGWYSI